MRIIISFCEECRKEVECKIEVGEMTEELKGKEYKFYGKKAICSGCGAELYVGEIEDDNLKALYDEYRLQNNIISLEKILELPKKYGIGKRNLSKLLGWGEMTFSRYCEGYIPTKEYSDKLREIYEKPEYFLSVLENSKDEIISKEIKEKSKNKIQKLLSTEGEKIWQVVGYILSKAFDITPLTLQKLLYYSQGVSYICFGKPIFNDDCEAWAHGPVFRSVYCRFHGWEPIYVEKEIDFSALNESEKAIIDSVMRNFGCYSGRILEQFTHLETPWLKTRADLPVGEPSNRIIEKKLIAEYFTAIKEKYNIVGPGDVFNYAESMFNQVI